MYDLATLAGVGEPGAGSFAEPLSARTSRRAALLAAAAATLFLIFGTYTDHWTWTGFSANGQVWDWMQLLLLPVAIGTFPLWLRFSEEMSPSRRKALGAAALAFTAFVVAGYLVPLTWTGYPDNTLWDWLKLFLAPIAVTTFVVPELITVVAGDIGDDAA